MPASVPPLPGVAATRTPALGGLGGYVALRTVKPDPSIGHAAKPRGSSLPAAPYRPPGRIQAGCPGRTAAFRAAGGDLGIQITRRWGHHAKIGRPTLAPARRPRHPRNRPATLVPRPRGRVVPIPRSGNRWFGGCGDLRRCGRRGRCGGPWHRSPTPTWPPHQDPAAGATGSRLHGRRPDHTKSPVSSDASQAGKRIDQAIAGLFTVVKILRRAALRWGGRAGTYGVRTRVRSPGEASPSPRHGRARRRAGRPPPPRS